MIKGKVTAKKRTLRQMLRRTQRAAAEFNTENAEETAEMARLLVHVRTGETRDSIHVEVDESKREAKVVVGGGGLHEELGTVYRPPHPFLTPAAEQTVVGIPSRARKMRI